jgi:hypothetical protein
MYLEFETTLITIVLLCGLCVGKNKITDYLEQQNNELSLCKGIVQHTHRASGTDCPLSVPRSWLS